MPTTSTGPLGVLGDVHEWTNKTKQTIVTIALALCLHYIHTVYKLINRLPLHG